jgi:DNA (cytosine-5)-methyltransferase 1
VTSSWRAGERRAAGQSQSPCSPGRPATVRPAGQGGQTPVQLRQRATVSMNGDGDFRVVDLFSGAGGMSFGFASNPRFDLVGAVDVEVGKPSTGHGALECNATYEANVGLSPLALDLGRVRAGTLRSRLGLSGPIDVLLTCPPCTGFSRVNAGNHLVDDPRNRLLRRTVAFVRELQPSVVLMENAREVLTGSFREHFNWMASRLTAEGYEVHADVHMLNRFGLPQQRERALIVMVKRDLPLLTMRDLWAGLEVDEKATHVRRALWDLPALESGATDASDPAHSCTNVQGPPLERLRVMPHDGGSWRDLLGHPDLEQHLTPGMRRSVERGRLNQHCDIYGRMAWDRPAPTIKRECSHVGNGRYGHPEQDRLCSVREMALLQGFPAHYAFPSRSRKNAYRNIGDAVPPMISFQLSRLAEWILGGTRPEPESLVLPGTTLRADDIRPY